MGSIVRRVAAAVTLVLVLGACGGDGPGIPDEGSERAAPETWLATVCGATAGWVDEIMALNEDLQASLDANSVQALKDAMIGYFDDILAATGTMIDEVDGAGVPDVDGGAEAADAISSGLRDARDILQRARDDAANLSTADPQAFSQDLQAIGQEVQTSLSEVGDAMGELESPDLDTVAEDVPECQELNAL